MTKDESNKRDYTVLINDKNSWGAIYHLMDTKGYLNESEAITDILFNCDYMLQKMIAKEKVEHNQLFNQVPDPLFEEQTALELIINNGHAKDEAEALQFAIRCYTLHSLSNSSYFKMISEDRRKKVIQQVALDAVDKNNYEIINKYENEET